MDFPTITHHGAVNGVTGSCHELALDGQNSVLVDCGLFQGTEASGRAAGVSDQEIDFDVDRVRALLVTHCHIDHVGRIPHLLAAGFGGPVYCSEATANLLPLVLEDALRISSVPPTSNVTSGRSPGRSPGCSFPGTWGHPIRRCCRPPSRRMAATCWCWRVPTVTEGIRTAGSGMCNGGRIVDYLKALLGDTRTDIAFVGYQARGTPGRAIQRYGPEGGWVELDGERYAIRAGVHTLGGYSAHADRNGLLGFVRRMRRKPREIRLVHGDEAAKRVLQTDLREVCPKVDVLIPG